MAEYTFKADLTLDLPIDEVFAFFADAENLERITPAELGFHILTPTPFEIRQGTLIDYKLTLHGFPMKWRTEITRWEPPHLFEDTQLSGPYKQWIHQHRFTEIEIRKTLMQDEVRYRLPFEPLGDIANFLISRQVANIFEHRNKAVAEFLLPHK
ncbi:MAG: SRPBCC family protein [Chloracidobacterium sp.]|nr:SRPBCC family protein [Chloracidobacterium sp.]